MKTIKSVLEELYNAAWVEGSNWKRNNPENSDIPSEREIKKTNKALNDIESILNEAKPYPDTIGQPDLRDVPQEYLWIYFLGRKSAAKDYKEALLKALGRGEK